MAYLLLLDFSLTMINIIRLPKVKKLTLINTRLEDIKFVNNQHDNTIEELKLRSPNGMLLSTFGIDINYWKCLKKLTLSNLHKGNIIFGELNTLKEVNITFNVYTYTYIDMLKLKLETFSICIGDFPHPMQSFLKTNPRKKMFLPNVILNDETLTELNIFYNDIPHLRNVFDISYDTCFKELKTINFVHHINIQSYGRGQFIAFPIRMHESPELQKWSYNGEKTINYIFHIAINYGLIGNIIKKFKKKVANYRNFLRGTATQYYNEAGIKTNFREYVGNKHNLNKIYKMPENNKNLFFS